MNSKAKGEVSEAAVIAKLVEIGLAVSIPFGNNQRYDLVVENHNGALIKAQVKTAKLSKDGNYLVFRTCSTNGFTGEHKDYRKEIDIFLVYAPEIRRFFEVPVDDVGVQSCNLRLTPAKRVKDKTIRWADTYDLDKGQLSAEAPVKRQRVVGS